MKQFINTLNEDCGTFHISTQNLGFSRFEMIGILDAVLAKERAEMNEDMAPKKPSPEKCIPSGPMPDNTLDRLLAKKQPPVRLSKKPLSKTNKYLRDPKMRKKMIATSVRTSSKIDS